MEPRRALNSQFWSGGIFGFWLVLLCGCASHPPSRHFSVTVSDLQYGYKVDGYILAAAHLQSLNHSTALERLHAMARDEKSGDKVIVLCRMLFTQRKGTDFRRPMIGGAAFLGGTDYPDWPREPIELVNGVPFLITQGYILGGSPEPADSYLRYCETNCDWSNFHYTAKTQRQKQDALRKLISSPKWKKPLDTNEREFLKEQIR